ncbi:MAG: hypothetical protein JNM10_12895 [Planctomycetia bacterium]|nr:hypothetical protein [Planctomycetia bacterium]
MAEPPPPPAAPPPDAGPVSPTGRPGLPLRYRTPDEVKAALDAIAARPAWGARKARVERYGTSAGGRALWVLRIGPDAAPQVLVHGGLGARDAAGTVAAIAFADATCPDVTPAEGGAAPRLPPPDDRVGWLVIPAPNPDALAAFLEGKPRFGGPDVDRDQDGRAGEDGPDDLDGDGEVVSMRRRVPDGPFAPDDAPAKDGKALGDPRALKDAGPDTRRAVSFTRPVEEGKDDDGDGDVNEDPPGTDLARNLMGVWEEMGRWPGDGPFPGSAPEAKALLDLSWDTPALIGWYGFTSEGARLERASERGNDADADDALYGRLAGPWREAAGGVELRKASERPGAAENRGSDLDWAARHLGVPALRVPVWRITKEAGSARERHDPDEVDWLLWNDRVLGGKGFVPWHEVAHPQLGTVEVGGWKRFTRWEPPADLLPDAVRRVMRVPEVHAAFAPRLVVRVEVTARGAGLASVKVRVDNVGGGPTDTVRAERAAKATPVRLEFAPAEGVEVLAGPRGATLGTLPAGGSSAPTEWLVRRAGAGPLGVATAAHRVAGVATAEGRLP